MSSKPTKSFAAPAITKLSQATSAAALRVDAETLWNWEPSSRDRTGRLSGDLLRARPNRILMNQYNAD